MTTLTFTSTQSWTIPSDCRFITSIESVGSGAPGTAGGDCSAFFPGNGGNGGGGGARAVKYNVAVTPGTGMTVYAGNGSGTYSGLYSSIAGWLCLAYSAQGSTGGQAAWGYVGDYISNGSSGVTGDPGTGQGSDLATGGKGGNGGTSDYGGAGLGGTPGGQVYGQAFGNPGGNATNWGSGGGGGGGGGYLAVQGPGGAGGAAYQGFVQIIYTPYVARPPTVTSVSPSFGSPGGGQSVVITGTNFDNGVSAVKFGATNASSFVVNSSTQITAVTPQHAYGIFDVMVTNVDGTSATSSSDHYTFKATGLFNAPMGGL